MKSRLPAETSFARLRGQPVDGRDLYGGGPEGSRDQAQARLHAYADPEAFSAIVEAIAASDGRLSFRPDQRRGEDAVQLFDSWSGSLSPEQFERWAIAPTARIVRRAEERFIPGRRSSAFPRGPARSWSVMRTGRTSMRSASTRRSIPPGPPALLGNLPLQGNLDPLALLAGGATLEKAVGRIIYLASREAAHLQSRPRHHQGNPDRPCRASARSGAPVTYEIGYALTVTYAWLKAGHIIFVDLLDREACSCCRAIISIIRNRRRAPTRRRNGSTVSASCA